MSMLDSFFNKGFKAAKCKTLLKLTTPRIKLLRNRRMIQVKQMRHDIAKLLETGQEATARIRVEHIIRENKMMEAQEILELFCELISVRLPIIEAQRECPLDLKEAISSICFAAPRCADLPELQQVQMMFVGKYGREFVAAAAELMPDCGVNRRIIELLSIRPPPAADKLEVLKDIAEEYALEWDPAASETELFKSHEDLLNGSTEFMTGAKLLPLPKEKHDESLYSAPEPTTSRKEEEDEEEGDSLDFPEVPKASVVRASAPLQMFPLSPQAFQNHPQEFPEIKENIYRSRPDEEEEEQTVDTTKQFLPFISPPSFPSASSYVRDEPKETPPPEDLTFSRTIRDESKETQPPEDLTFSRTIRDEPKETSPEVPTHSRSSEASVDLQEVITAAKAAAESAERAAATARSAACLAQLRIKELNLKNDTSVLNPTIPDTSFDDNPFGTETVVHGSPSDSPKVHQGLYESERFPVDTLKFDDDSPSPPKHQPERLPSMDDDPYSTYPSLFSSQISTNGRDSHLFNETRFDKDP